MYNGNYVLEVKWKNACDLLMGCKKMLTLLRRNADFVKGVQLKGHLHRMAPGTQAWS